LGESGEDREVGVTLHLCQSTDAERCKAVLIFQVAEGAFHGGTSAVEAAEALSVTRDAREQPSTDFQRQHRRLG